MGSSSRWLFEPPDVLEGGELDVLEAAPRAPESDQLGLVGPDDRLGQRVVVGVSAAADRRFDPCQGQVRLLPDKRKGPGQSAGPNSGGGGSELWSTHRVDPRSAPRNAGQPFECPPCSSAQTRERSSLRESRRARPPPPPWPRNTNGPPHRSGEGHGGGGSELRCAPRILARLLESPLSPPSTNSARRLKPARRPRCASPRGFASRRSPCRATIRRSPNRRFGWGFLKWRRRESNPRPHLLPVEPLRV